MPVCEIYPGFCDSDCILKKTLVSQAEKGGSDNKTLSLNGKVGPFWSRAGWTGFVEKNIEVAATGCGERAVVDELAKKLTKAKSEAHELV